MTDLGRGYGSQPWHAPEPGYGEQPQRAASPGEQEYLPEDPYGRGHQYPVHGQEQYGQQQAYVPMDPYAQQQWQQQQQQQQQLAQQQQQLPQPPQGYQPYPPQQQGGYAQPQGYQQIPQQQFPQQQMQRQSQQELSQQQFPQQLPPQMSQQQPQQRGIPQQQMQQQPPHPQSRQPMPQQGIPQQQAQQQGIPQQQPPQRQSPQQQIPRQAPQPAPAPRRPAGPGPDGIDWEAEAAALEAGTAAEQYAEDGYDEYTDEELAEGEYADGEYQEDGEFTEEGEPAGEAEQLHSFLGEQDDSDEAKAKRKAKGKKTGRRNGGACLLVALVLLGGVGGAGWWGYGVYQRAVAPPADYQGNGAGKVQVQIQDGASATDMAVVLKQADVVKSTGAFTNAYAKAGKLLQPGYYDMQKQMSGDAAVALMISEAGGDSLIVPEGKKASDIYAMIDTKLKLAAGTTAAAAKANVANLGLPAYANNNPEGFLWPTKYSVSAGMKPADLLKQMVSNALAQYSQLNLDGTAASVGLKNAYAVITEASILQAEGNNVADFGKMARVINNRLGSDTVHHSLGMDTTLQYSVGSKTLTDAQIKDGSNKYNTYINPGLPPTPISNPGADAIQAVLNPTPGPWLFFLAMSPTETIFSTSQDDFAQNVKNYCTQHNQGFDAKHVVCD